MDIGIITWSEGFYEHYMKILKGKNCNLLWRRL